MSVRSKYLQAHTHIRTHTCTVFHNVQTVYIVVPGRSACCWEATSSGFHFVLGALEHWQLVFSQSGQGLQAMADGDSRAQQRYPHTMSTVDIS
eukprot:COSAG02_NODE_662_length_18752_cov_10.146464_6_plen_93_part_00